MGKKYDVSWAPGGRIGYLVDGEPERKAGMSEKIQRYSPTSCGDGVGGWTPDENGDCCFDADVAALESRLAEAEKERDEQRRIANAALAEGTRLGALTESLSARVRELEGALRAFPQNSLAPNYIAGVQEWWRTRAARALKGEA